MSLRLVSVPPLDEDLEELLWLIRSSPGPIRPPCLDYEATDYQIHPCDQCETWWAEVVRDERGQRVVREWHNPACEVLHEIEWD